MAYKFELTIDKDTFTVTNVDTGETQTVDLPKSTKKKSSTKTVKDDGDPTPRITVEENKYCLNKAAADLLVDSSVDVNRLEIKFEKQGKISVPVILNSDNGNKVTKTNTVACRGKQHDELIKYGTEFVLEAHPNKDGVFYLRGNVEVEPEPSGDDNFEIPEDNDLDLDGLMATGDEETEIDGLDLDL